MNRLLSIYFDLWRIVAALLVFVWHTSSWSFSDGTILRAVHYSTGAEHLAVVIFFVLSGYLIAFSALKPGVTWRQFLVNRLARLSSVTIPALILTAGVAILAWKLKPFTFEACGMASYQPLRYLANGLYLQQSWFFCIVPGMNSPFWSLGYEAPYYCALGIAVFTPKSRRGLALSALAVLAGPKVALLFPTWAIGVLALRLSSVLTVHTRTLWSLFGISFMAMVAGLACPALIPFWSEKIGHPPLFYSYNFVADLIFSVVVAVNFFAARRLGESNSLSSSPQLERFGQVSSYAAGMTFSLYLYHVPLLFLFGTFGRYDRHSLPEVTLAALLVLSAVTLLAHLTERRLSLWRELVQAALNWTSYALGRLQQIRASFRSIS